MTATGFRQSCRTGSRSPAAVDPRVDVDVDVALGRRGGVRPCRWLPQAGAGDVGAVLAVGLTARIVADSKVSRRS